MIPNIYPRENSDDPEEEDGELHHPGHGEEGHLPDWREDQEDLPARGWRRAQWYSDQQRDGGWGSGGSCPSLPGNNNNTFMHI